MAELFANPLTDVVIVNLISAGLYMIIGIVLISILMKFINSFLRDKEIERMLSKLGIKGHALDVLFSGIRIYFYFILFLIILGRLGVSSILTDLIIVILILSVVGISLISLKNIIPNAAAGIYISSTNMVSKNEKIVVNNLEGEVEEITLLNTILKKGKKEKIIIPNSLLIKNKVIKK